MNWLRRLLAVLMLTIGAVYCLLMVVALFADHMIFQPHPASYRLAELQARGIQTYRVDSGGTKIAAIYLPNPSARYTLLYSHGNGEDLGDDLEMLEQYRDAGFAVFAYDYEGYGESDGRPSEAGLYRDVESAYEFLTTALGVPASRVISHGHSLGAAAAIHLASVRPVAGLIADAPFVSAFRVITQVPLLPWDKFNNGLAIRSVRCPVLVVHGRRDRIIPFWHGQRIYALANEPKQHLWIERCGHNDAMLVAPALYVSTMQRFVQAFPAVHAAAETQLLRPSASTAGATAE